MADERTSGRRWPAYAHAGAAVAVASAVGWGVRRAGWSGADDRANLVMAYLLAVVYAAARLGRGPAVLASVVGVVAFAALFVPPVQTRAVAEGGHAITLASMLAVVVVTTELTERVRQQADLARRRERRTADLLAVSRALAEARDAAAVGAVVVARAAAAFDGAAALFDADRREAATAGGDVAANRRAVEWAADNRRPAGAGTSAMPDLPSAYQPLAGTDGGGGGVLVVRPADPADVADPEHRELLAGFAALAAAALERVALAEQARAAWERVEAEFLRNTLLSSVSHDLRTPLAAIAGAADTLLSDPPPDPATARDLTETVLDEARRMERVITNLLDMTRLESGGLHLRREWQPVAEMVGSALRRTRDRLGGRPVSVDLPADLPMVHVDAVAMEQVVVNLLDNAVEYTPAGSPLDVAGRAAGDRLVIAFGDRGPGVPAGTERQVFQKFFRAHAAAGGRRGIGLGLAICRGIVESLGGTVTAANRPGGGAVFTIELPIGDGPAVVPDDA